MRLKSDLIWIQKVEGRCKLSKISQYRQPFKSVCGVLTVGRGMLPEFICHLDSQKMGAKACSESEETARDSSLVTREGEAKTAEEKRRFARLDVSASAPTLPLSRIACEGSGVLILRGRPSPYTTVQPLMRTTHKEAD